MAGIGDFMSSSGETYNVVNLGGFTKDRVPKTNTKYTNSAGYTGGVSAFDPATDPAMKGYGSPVNENAQSKPTTQVNRALDKGLINRSDFTPKTPLTASKTFSLSGAGDNSIGYNTSTPQKSIPTQSSLSLEPLKGNPQGGASSGSQNTSYSGEAGEKIRVGSRQTTGRATMEVPTDKANYTDTKNHTKIEPNKGVAVQGAQYEKITPNTSISVGGSGGSIPPEEPPLVGSGSSFGANGGWKGLVSRLTPNMGTLKSGVAGLAAYGVTKAIQSGVEGAAKYSDKADPNASMAGHAIGNTAQFILDGQAAMKADQEKHRGLVGETARFLGDAFTRKDQLKPDQVLAAPDGSKDMDKLQKSLAEAKAGKGYASGETPLNDVTGQPMPRASGTTFMDKDGKSHLIEGEDPMDREQDSAGPKWSKEASEDPSSPFYGKSDHSGDSAAKMKYIEQQALLGNKDASFGHEGTTPEGLVKKGWTQDPDKMVDGWAKSASVNPEGVVPKDEDPGTHQMQSVRKARDMFEPGSAEYKTLDKSLAKLTASNDFHKPKEDAASGKEPSLLTTSVEEVPGKYTKTQGEHGTSYGDNPEYQAYRSRGNGTEDGSNPVSLMTIGEKGEHIYSENPNHTDINTGRTRVQEYQYQHDPQRKVEEHMAGLVRRAAHEEFMSDDKTRNGLIHMQRAAQLGDEINALNISMGDERKSRYQTDGLVTSNIHKDDTDERGSIRTNTQSGVNQNRASEASEYGYDKTYKATVLGHKLDFQAKMHETDSKSDTEALKSGDSVRSTQITVDGASADAMAKNQQAYLKEVEKDRVDNMARTGSNQKAWADSFLHNNKSSDAGVFTTRVASGLANSPLPLGNVDANTYAGYANAYSKLLKASDSSDGVFTQGYKLPVFFPEMVGLSQEGVVGMARLMSAEGAPTTNSPRHQAERARRAAEMYEKFGGDE